MKYILAFCLLIVYIKVQAQINLVPNPSFEDPVECPHFNNQVDKAVGWWPSNESPDYFHECDWMNGNTAVPQNFCGFQYANHGSAYVGFIAYYRPVQNIREYFTCELTSILQIGVKYYYSFYVSLAGGGGKQIPCNKLGVLFSTTSYTLSNPPPTNNFAHIYTDSIISDTLNWVKIEGSFIADSNYAFLSVGNFFDDAHTDTTFIIPSSAAYYFFDSFTVMVDSLTGIKNSSYATEVLISPNPFLESVNIQFENKKAILFEIYDIDSKSLITATELENSRNSISRINLGFLKAGVYVLKLIYKDNTSTLHKLIKIE